VIRIHNKNREDLSMKTSISIAALAATASLLQFPAALAAFPAPPVAAPGVTVDVLASGLRDPRGLALGAGHQILVAEAGTTEGVFVPPPPPPQQEPPTRTRCEVYWPVGPRTGGATGRVVSIGSQGQVRVLADGLPSAASNALIGGDRFGAAGVALRGERVYAMINGGGCSNGHPSDPEGLYRIHANGTAQPVADLGNFMRSNVDSKSPLDGDFEPDGTWFNLVRAFGAFYSTEPNHGLLVRIGDDGAISLVADLIAAIKAMDGDGDHTYSALTVHRGAFYVGTLGRIDAGFTASIYRVSRDGRQVTRVASGLHGVTGIAFDRAGRLYALETTAANVNPPLSDPTVGRLVRVEGNGSLTPLVTNLAFPTALLAGREGEFYISNCGYHCDDRSKLSLPSLQVGQVLRVTLPDAESDQDDARD
jgi:hypothetical protein